MSAPRQGGLDGLRGLAAFVVLTYHYLYKGPLEGWLRVPMGGLGSVVASYGYLGVHVFFMISGYVIMLTAERASLRGFIASRVSRLVPAFWACCLLTAGAQAVLPGSPFPPPSLAQLAANFTLVPGWLGVPAVDGAYWSLQVEITFYAWVAALIGAGLTSRLERCLVPWLILSAADAVRPMYRLELVTCVQWAPLFALGATCHFARSRGWNRARLATSGVCVALALVHAWREALMLLDRGESNAWAQRPGIVMAIVAAAMLLFAWSTTRAEQPKATAFTAMAGALTYPLYLLHQNIGYAAINSLLAMSVLGALGPTPIIVLVTMAVMAAAWSVHVHVERSFGRWLRHTLEGRPLVAAPRPL